MRITLSRIVSACVIVAVVIVVINIFQAPKFTHTCNQPKELLINLKELIVKVRNILVQNDLMYFLCYGSLWGQIRYSDTLPWADKVQICIRNENKVLPVKDFIANGLYAKFVSAQGMYLITDPNINDAVLELIIFDDTKSIKMFHRVGWKHKLLPPDCEWTSLDCFPTELLIKPLPTVTYLGTTFNVPRSGFEIQKYHYPNSWWNNDIADKNCIL